MSKIVLDLTDSGIDGQFHRALRHPPRWTRPTEDAVLEFNSEHLPGGSPGGTGGEFAPKGEGGEGAVATGSRAPSIAEHHINQEYVKQILNNVETPSNAGEINDHLKELAGRSSVVIRVTPTSLAAIVQD